MSERFFDNLARTLASPMPRRRALRLTGAAIVAAAVPGLRPRSALGQSPCGPDTPCSSLCLLTNPKGACGIAIFNDCGQELCHVGTAGCITPDKVCCPTAPDPWYCEKGEVCGAKAGECTCPTMCQDGTCCPRSKGRCVNGKCCPAIRTTFKPGSKKKAVACCPPGTVAVPGGEGLCCPKSKPKCCDAYDKRVDNGDLASLGVKRGQLCVNGKVRRG